MLLLPDSATRGTFHTSDGESPFGSKALRGPSEERTGTASTRRRDAARWRNETREAPGTPGVDQIQTVEAAKVRSRKADFRSGPMGRQRFRAMSNRLRSGSKDRSRYRRTAWDRSSRSGPAT